MENEGRRIGSGKDDGKRGRKNVFYNTCRRGVHAPYRGEYTSEEIYGLSPPKDGIAGRFGAMRSLIGVEIDKRSDLIGTRMGTEKAVNISAPCAR